MSIVLQWEAVMSAGTQLIADLSLRPRRKGWTSTEGAWPAETAPRASRKSIALAVHKNRKSMHKSALSHRQLKGLYKAIHAPPPPQKKSTHIYTNQGALHNSKTWIITPSPNLTKRVSAMCTCIPIKKKARRPSSLRFPPLRPVLQVIDTIYMARGSDVNAMSKAPGHWQAKIKCLQIEM